MLILFVFFRHTIGSCCNFSHAVSRTTGPALIIIYAVFPVCAAIVFNTFMTESFDDGTERLLYDFSVQVSDAHYDLMLKYAICMVAVYPVGIPLLFAVILFRNRRALRDESREVDGELVRDSKGSLDQVAVLFDVYKPRKWWWEVSLYFS